MNRIIEGIDIAAEANDTDRFFDIIEKHINSRYMLVRNHIAETLMDFSGKQSFDILTHLLIDKDRVVRASACGSLSIFTNIETVSILLNVISSDKSPLVRKYAAGSTLIILKHLDCKDDLYIDFFNERKERSIPAKISYYMILYYLGQEKYLDYILSYINHDNYINRINAINALGLIITLKNTQKVKTVVDERLATEDSIAVKSSILNLYNNISQIENPGV